MKLVKSRKAIKDYLRDEPIPFVGVLEKKEDMFYLSTMDSIKIGQSVYLWLEDGRIAKTSPVVEWYNYGDTSIDTQNHHYYANNLIEKRK